MSAPGGRPLDWRQYGYVVISESNTAIMPFVHGFHLTRWEADESIKLKTSTLNAKLTLDIRVVAAVVIFSSKEADDD